MELPLFMGEEAFCMGSSYGEVLQGEGGARHSEVEVCDTCTRRKGHGLVRVVGVSNPKPLIGRVRDCHN